MTFVLQCFNFSSVWKIKGVKGLLPETFYLKLRDSTLSNIAVGHDLVPLLLSNHDHVCLVFCYHEIIWIYLHTLVFWFSCKKECSCQHSFWTAIVDTTLQQMVCHFYYILYSITIYFTKKLQKNPKNRMALKGIGTKENTVEMPVLATIHRSLGWNIYRLKHR